METREKFRVHTPCKVARTATTEGPELVNGDRPGARSQLRICSTRCELWPKALEKAAAFLWPAQKGCPTPRSHETVSAQRGHLPLAPRPWGSDGGPTAKAAELAAPHSSFRRAGAQRILLPGWCWPGAHSPRMRK